MDKNTKLMLLILVWGVLSGIHIGLGVLFIVLIFLIAELTNKHYEVSEVGDLLIAHPRQTKKGDKVIILANQEKAKEIKNNVQFEKAWKVNNEIKKYILEPYTRRHQEDGLMKIFCLVIN